MGQIKMYIKLLSGNLKGGRPCGRSGHRYYDNINTDHKEIGWNSVNCTHVLEKGPVADCCDHYNECLDSIKGGD
jgi:hypothetical protein